MTQAELQALISAMQQIKTQTAYSGKIPSVPEGIPYRQYVPQNTNLNFEKRILNPEQYPELNNDDGSFATHQMAWSSGKNGYYAFPTIIQDPVSGNLKSLSPLQAVQYAIKSGEYRKFNTPEEAEQYANGGYKYQWGTGTNQEK